jgi:class 3 adenylate cyclase
MSADTEQRKLAAIMFTDMVGYSALPQRDDKPSATPSSLSYC